MRSRPFGWTIYGFGRSLRRSGLGQWFRRPWRDRRCSLAKPRWHPLGEATGRRKGHRLLKHADVQSVGDRGAHLVAAGRRRIGEHWRDESSGVAGGRVGNERG